MLRPAVASSSSTKAGLCDVLSEAEVMGEVALKKSVLENIFLVEN